MKLTTMFSEDVTPEQTTIHTDDPIKPGLLVETEKGEVCWVNPDGYWVRGVGSSTFGRPPPQHYEKGSVVWVIGTAELEEDDGHTPG